MEPIFTLYALPGPVNFTFGASGWLAVFTIAPFLYALVSVFSFDVAFFAE